MWTRNIKERILYWNWCKLTFGENHITTGLGPMSLFLSFYTPRKEAVAKLNNIHFNESRYAGHYNPLFVCQVSDTISIFDAYRHCLCEWIVFHTTRMIDRPDFVNLSGPMYYGTSRCGGPCLFFQPCGEDKTAWKDRSRVWYVVEYACLKERSAAETRTKEKLNLPQIAQFFKSLSWLTIVMWTVEIPIKSRKVDQWGFLDFFKTA